MEFPEMIAEDSAIDINGKQGRVFKVMCRISDEIYSNTRVIAPLEWEAFGHDRRFRKGMYRDVIYGLIDNLIEEALV